MHRVGGEAGAVFQFAHAGTNEGAGRSQVVELGGAPGYKLVFRIDRQIGKRCDAGLCSVAVNRLGDEPLF